MKRISSMLVGLAALFVAPALFASTCPTTINTNTDCGYILTIGSGGVVTGAPVSGANPYDGTDDSLVGVINNSGATYTGSILLTSSNDIFGFENDGICTFTGASYCSNAPTGYEGPLNTFSNINGSLTSGDVNISGLGSGSSTYFSLEGSPAAIGSVVVGSPIPEPSTWVLTGSGILGLFGLLFVRWRRDLPSPLCHQSC